MTVIVIAMHCGLLDCSIHAFDVTVGPWVLWFGRPVVNVMNSATVFERMAPEQLSFCPHHSDVSKRPAFSGRVGELDAIVGENCVYLVWNSGIQIVQKLL